MARPRKNPEATPLPEKTQPASSEPDAVTAATAFSSVSPELAGLDAAELRPVPADVPAAVAIALAALPRLHSLREAIVSELPKHPVASLDKLEQYALAAWFAHLVSTMAGGTGGEPYKALVEEAQALRKSLLVAAEPLALKGLVEVEKVKAIRSGQGHKDLARDLVDLGALYREAWPRVKNKTATEIEEVDRAEKLGQQLLSMIAVRDSGAVSGSVDDIADRRARAFSLLQRAWEDTQRAVAYLRWRDGDAESFAPSLFKAPRARRGKGGDEGVTAAPPTVESDADAVPAI